MLAAHEAREMMPEPQPAPTLDDYLGPIAAWVEQAARKGDGSGRVPYYCLPSDRGPNMPHPLLKQIIQRLGEAGYVVHARNGNLHLHWA